MLRKMPHSLGGIGLLATGRISAETVLGRFRQDWVRAK